MGASCTNLYDAINPNNVSLNAMRTPPYGTPYGWNVTHLMSVPQTSIDTTQNPIGPSTIGTTGSNNADFPFASTRGATWLPQSQDNSTFGSNSFESNAWARVDPNYNNFVNNNTHTYGIGVNQPFNQHIPQINPPLANQPLVNHALYPMVGGQNISFIPIFQQSLNSDQANNQFQILPHSNPNQNCQYQDNQPQPHNQNIECMVKHTLNKHGFNVGKVDQFVSSSPFPDEVQMLNLSTEYKIPKFTKFAGDSGESTYEHVARYLLKCGEIANSELLRMKYFPCSLTREAFSWFTTLAPKSVHSWSQLESLFHEKFYKGKVRIAIIDLANVRRKFGESIDNYLIRFRQLKSRCSTPIPEIELIKMAIKGLDFSLRKKLIEYHVVNMFQLADVVHKIEKSNLEKYMSDKFIQQDQVEYPDEEDTSNPYTSSSSDEDEDSEKVINYVEPKRFEINMVNISNAAYQSNLDHVMKKNKISEKKVFPNDGEFLPYLLSRKKDFERDDMLCPKNDILFDQTVLKQYVEKNDKFYLKIPSKIKFSELGFKKEGIQPFS